MLSEGHTVFPGVSRSSGERFEEIRYQLGLTSAASPTRDELGGSRRTTVARTNASPRGARAEAR